MSDKVIPIPSVPLRLRNEALYVTALKDPEGFFTHLANGKHNGFAAFGDAREPSVILFDETAVGHAFGRNYTEKGPAAAGLLEPILGDALLFTGGERWKKQHDLAVHSFAPRNHDLMLQHMVAATRDMLQGWQRSAEIGEPVKLTRDFPRLTYRILLSALFNETGWDKTEIIQDAVGVILAEARARAARIFKEPIGNVFAKPSFIAAKDTIRGATEEILARRRHALNKSPDLPDLLSVMIRHYDRSNDPAAGEELVRQVATMILAGQETTGQGMNGVAIEATKNPHQWQRVVAESRAVLGNGDPTLAHMRQLSITDAFVKESIRLHPPAPFIVRVAPAADKIPMDTDKNGRTTWLTVPEGQDLVISMAALHRRHKYWGSDAEQFDPDRFAPDLVAARAKHAYAPFAAGPRVCIGGQMALLEMKLATAMMAREGPDFTVREAADIRMLPMFTSRPDRDVYADVSPRKSGPGGV